MTKHHLKPYTLIEQIVKLYPENSLQILAASIKTIQELETTLMAGAQLLTLPWPLFKELANHPLTDFATEDFQKTGMGLL